MIFDIWQVSCYNFYGDYMKDKGFTLIELLAVIVVLGILISIAATNVYKYINSASAETLKVARDNLNDAAVSYALNNVNIVDDCALTTTPTNFDVSLQNGCTKNLVTVKILKDNGFFTDDKNICKETSEVLIYKYHDTTYNTYDMKAFVPDSACED